MVLDHVANGAGFIVESAASLHSEFLRHGDLHALDVVAIPERLHEGVGKPENDHVVHRPLAEIVVNAKDSGLGEGCMQDAVELLRRGKVMTEGLLDNDAGTLAAVRLRQLFHDRSEQEGRDSQIVRRPLRSLEFFADRVKSGGV